MWRILLSQSPSLQAWSQRMSRHGWALRGALFFTLAVIAIPLIALILAALLLGIVTFVVLSLVAKVMGLVGAGPGTAARRGASAGPDLERRNVRVVRDEM